MLKEIIVTAYLGEPVRLVELGRANGLVYVANPDSLSRVSSGATEPVGVPAEDVQEYDSETYRALRERWLKGARPH